MLLTYLLTKCSKINNNVQKYIYVRDSYIKTKLQCYNFVSFETSYHNMGTTELHLFYQINKILND